MISAAIPEDSCDSGLLGKIHYDFKDNKDLYIERTESGELLYVLNQMKKEVIDIRIYEFMQFIQWSSRSLGSNERQEWTGLYSIQRNAHV